MDTEGLGGELALWFDAAPTWSPSSFNGLPGLAFASSNSQSLATPPLFPQQWSAFAVVNFATAGSSYVLGMDNGSSARIAAPVLLVAGPVLRCEAFTTGSTAFVSFQGVSTATNYIFTGLRTGTQVLSGFNGGGLASTSTAGTPNSGNSLAAIGTLLGQTFSTVSLAR